MFSYLPVLSSHERLGVTDYLFISTVAGSHYQSIVYNLHMALYIMFVALPRSSNRADLSTLLFYIPVPVENICKPTLGCKSLTSWHLFKFIHTEWRSAYHPVTCIHRWLWWLCIHRWQGGIYCFFGACSGTVVWKNKAGVGISTQMCQDYYRSAILRQNESEYYSLIYWHSGQDLIYHTHYTLAGVYVCVCVCCDIFWRGSAIWVDLLTWPKSKSHWLVTLLFITG